MTGSMDQIRRDAGEHQYAGRPGLAQPAFAGMAAPTRVTTVAPGTIRPRAVVRAGGAPATRLGADARVFLLALTVLAAIGATVHPFVSAGVATGTSWWQTAASAALRWPGAGVQFVALVAAVATLAGSAAATAGWTRVRPWERWVAVGAAVVASLAVVPLVLLLIGWVLAIVVAVVLVCVVIGMLIAALAGS